MPITRPDDEKPMEPKSRIKSSQLKRLWTKVASQYKERDTRIKQSRSMVLQELRVPLPDEFEQKGKENLAVISAHGTTIPLKVINVFSRKPPKIRRSVKFGFESAKQSTKIETFVNACLSQLFDWEKVVDYGVNDAEYAVVVVPSEAHWEKVPSFLDAIEGGTDGKEKRIREVYSRDSKGRRKNDSYYKKNKNSEYKEDTQKSKETYEEVLKGYMARHLPFIVRIIPATDCAPLWGPNDKLEGLIIKQKYTRNELIRRNFVWQGMYDQLIPKPDESDTVIQYTGSADVTLYEGYFLSSEGTPFLVYEVDGKPTGFGQRNDKGDDEVVDAKIDLYEEYGLTRLPAEYFYGWHFKSKNPAQRGIPMIYPFIPSLLGSSALATATVIHAWWSAFGGYGYAPDPNLPAEAWLINGKPREFRIRPMTVQALPGPIQDFVHKGVGDDVYKMIGFMMQGFHEQVPGGSGVAFGGAGASSGHEASLMRNYLEDSLSQVLKGGMEAYEFAGEVILELACHIAEKYDIEIPVFADAETGTHAGNSKEGTLEKQVIELEPGDAGIIYDLTAYFPVKHGEFLAQGQQLADFVKMELATFEEFREMVFGDPAPEETKIKIMVDKMLMNSPIGQQYLLEKAMEYLGEAKLLEMVKLQAQNLMTQDGVPTAALQGVFGGDGGAGNTAMMRQTAARQALGGATSGGSEIQSNKRDGEARASMGTGQY